MASPAAVKWTAASVPDAPIANPVADNPGEFDASPLTELSEAAADPVTRPEEPIASSADVPEQTAVSAAIDVQPTISAAPDAHEQITPPSAAAVPASTATTSLNALAELVVATRTLRTRSVPVASNTTKAGIPASTNATERSDEYGAASVLRSQVGTDEQALVAIGAANDSKMDVDSANESSEAGGTNRPHPTKEDFMFWKGVAMQSLDSTESLNSDFNWLEYPQTWKPKKGVIKNDVKERLELFGQRVGLIVNAMAAESEISQSKAWAYTNILRKETRVMTDYNLYKAWRASKLRDENGGKSSKYFNCSLSICIHVFTAGDMGQINQFITAEWNAMSNEAKQVAVTTAKAELDEEQKDATEQELATPMKRDKYLKNYVDDLTSAVRVFLNISRFILIVTYRPVFKRHVQVSKRLASPCFRSREICPPLTEFSRPVHLALKLGRR
jgi:hypothetical protein